MALNARGVAKIAMIDPKTDKLTEINWPAKMPGTHNCDEDRDGNVWFASLGESDEGFYVYNPKTAQFRSYKYKLPTTYPAGSKALRDHAEGDPMPAVRAGLYDVRVDSQGKGWGVTYSMGMIVSVDPKTGSTKEYFAPETPHIRGMLVDSQDNIWFGGFDNHNDAESVAVRFRGGQEKGLHLVRGSQRQQHDPVRSQNRNFRRVSLPEPEREPAAGHRDRPAGSHLVHRVHEREHWRPGPG
jgi:streptogramin lyase